VGQLTAGAEGSNGVGIGCARGILARVADGTSHGGLELGNIAVGAIADGNALRLDNGLQILVAEGAQTAELLQIVILVHPEEAAILGLIDGTGLGLWILAIVTLAGVTAEAVFGQTLDIAGVTAAGGAGGIRAVGTDQLVRRLLVIQTGSDEIQASICAAIQSSHTLALALTSPVAGTCGFPQAGGILVGVAVNTGGVLTQGSGIVAVVGLARGAAAGIGTTICGDGGIRFDLILAAASGYCSI